MELDVHIPRFDDDDILLPDAEAFPPMAPPSDGVGLARSMSEVLREHESSESADAPLQRKRRAPKQLPVDKRQELHNADLAKWKNDYSANMSEAKEAKKVHQLPSQAKKNAAFWVMGAGIGGVGVALGSSKFRSPLDMFAGDAMMEALTGIKTTLGGRKRSYYEEEDHDSDSETRRVRMRDDDQEYAGRDDKDLLDDDDSLMISANEVILTKAMSRISADRLQGHRDRTACPSASRRSFISLECQLSSRVSSGLCCPRPWLCQ